MANCSGLFRRILAFSVIVLFFSLHSVAKVISIFADKSSPQASFAVSEITKVVQRNGDKIALFSLSDYQKNSKADLRLILATIADTLLFSEMKKENSSLKKEGFCIRKTAGKNPVIRVIGKDDAGLMYGGLELAEIIETEGYDGVSDLVLNPYMAIRGTKFNIPLDVRTPSYSDMSDAARMNIAEMWNFDFWKGYIDNLARYRYNHISLWNLHPFPSLVKVPGYPDIALNDVHQSSANLQENYNLNAIGLDHPDILNNFKIIRKLTIDQKIDFWQKVMKYGKERNISFYFLTWNIFTNGTFGKYGITDKADNAITRDYFRKSVKQLFLTYPDLAGIGLTTGENMYSYSSQEKEDWAFSTYGQGVLDVLKEQPDRKITFIHRQHQTGAGEIARQFAPLIKNKNINFVFSFKYAQAHVFSSTNQVFHQNFVKDIQAAGNLQTIWTLRNDDNFYFRWGAPDFVREFIEKIPYDVTQGFYYGSDQYVWGREFLSNDPENQRQLETSKHWYHWMLWGRLGYNPQLSNDRFEKILKVHFPKADVSKLFTAWQLASMIYPITTGFHWGSLDFQWYIESGQSRPDPAQTPSGYHDVNRFITLPPHKGTGYISIPDFVKAISSNVKIKGITPYEIADQLNNKADSSLSLVKGINVNGNKELGQTLSDIQSMAHLGKYYGYKILGATELALFRSTFKKEHLDKALAALNLSAGEWRIYASTSLGNYKNPLWTNRVGHVDWRKTYSYALYDITANGGLPDIRSMEPTPGGTILEAEDAGYKTARIHSDSKGFTGSGYLEGTAGDANQQIEWNYAAPEAGKYYLEFRYTVKREQLFDSPVLINGKPVGNLTFWMTGTPDSWVWDRISVNLIAGKNLIQISPEGFVRLDHLNIIKLYTD